VSPLALVLGVGAFLLALQFVRRAFGIGPAELVRRGLEFVRRAGSSAGTVLERRVEHVLAGQGERARRLAGPVAIVVAGSGWLAAGWLGALGASAAAVVVAVLGERTLVRRVARELARQVPQMCERVAAAMRAGRSLRASIARAASESGGPGARELARIKEDLDFGERLEVALRAACERTASPELRAVSATIEVQQRAGGSLAVALEDLADRLRAEERLRADVRTATAQARASAWLVAGLPVAGALAFEFAAPGSATALADHPLGLAAIAVSTVMYAAGLLGISRLARAQR
jgi:tight adherence protein B